MLRAEDTDAVPFLSERGLYPETDLEADVYAKQLVERIRIRAEAAGVKDLKDVTVFIHHRGEDIPRGVQWMIETIHASGAKTSVSRWDKDWKDMARRKRKRIKREKLASELMLELRHASKKHPDLEKWFDEPFVDSYLARVDLGFRMFFGMPNGFWVTAVPYLNDVTGVQRPRNEQIWDLILSTKLAVLTGIAAYAQIMNRFPNDPNIQVGAAVLTASIWRLLFGYTNRANNVLHNLGITYRRDLGRVVPKIRWSCLTMFLHSFVASMTFQWALRGAGNLTTEIFLETAKTSLIGMFAKVFPTRLLAQAEHGVDGIEDPGTKAYWKWVLILANTGMQFGLEILKFGTLMGGPSMTAIYWSLGLVGLAEVMTTHFFAKRRGNTFRHFWASFKKRARKDLAMMWRGVTDNGITRLLARCFGIEPAEPPAEKTQFRIKISCSEQLATAA